MTTKPNTTTKPQTILKLIKRKQGATIVQLQDATGWKAHSIRAAITGLRKKGHTVNRVPGGKAGTVYRTLEV